MGYKAEFSDKFINDMKKISIKDQVIIYEGIEKLLKSPFKGEPIEREELDKIITCRNCGAETDSYGYRGLKSGELDVNVDCPNCGGWFWSEEDYLSSMKSRPYLFKDKIIGA